MKNKVILYAVAIIIIFILGYFAHIQYFQTRANVIRYYNEKQITLANQAARNVQAFINARIKTLEIMSENFSANLISQENFIIEFRQTFNKISGFRTIFFLESDFNRKHIYPIHSKVFPECTQKSKEQFEVALKKARKHKHAFIFSQNVLIEGQVYVCLAAPVIQQNNIYQGSIIGVLNIDEILHTALSPLLDQNKDEAYVISAQGCLYYHPKKQEMLLNNVLNPQRECFSCHSDFTLEKRMIAKETEVGIKEGLLDSNKKLVGFAPIDLENIDLFIAISSSYNTVTDSIKTLFRNFLLITIFMIFTVVGFTVQVNRLDNQRNATEKEYEYFRAAAQLIEDKKAAENRYQTLVEQSPEPIFLCTRKKFLLFNQSFVKLFSLTKDEICSENFNIFDLVADSDLEFFKNALYKFIKSRRKILKLTLRMKSKRNQPLEVQMSIRRIMFDQTLAYQGIMNDMTQTRQLERETRRREHLALIGEMSARIAHEIKNPLASIQTGIQLLETQFPEDTEKLNYLMRLRGEIQRVDSILKGLLSYAREDKLNISEINIENYIHKFENLVKPNLQKSQLKLLVNIEKDMPLLKIDGPKIEQVLWNIFINAMQASQPGQEIKLKICRNHSYVEISFQDQGAGISKTELEKIFVPFYSTRTYGSGLGLAISKKIVELHNGSILIESKKDKGTKVTIRLPEV